MVLQRRLDYGFNGYQVPAMPRGSRSARGKVLFKKKAENKQMCAFDLLATVAGELLQEKDTSPNYSNQSVGQVDLLTRKDIVKKEEQDKDKLFKPGPYDQGSCDESVYAFPEKLQQHAQNGNLKHYCHAHGDTSLKPSSRITKFDRFEEVAYPEESTGKGRNGFGTSPIVSHANSSVQRGLPDFAESYNCKVEEELERQLQPQNGRIGSRGLPDMCNSEDPIDTKPPALVSSDSSVEVPLSGDRISQGVFFNRCQNDIKIVSRDDDENSSGCTQPRSTTMKTLRPPRIGDRRMRKLLASKCWKVAPVSLKHGNLSYYDMEMKPAFRSRKMCYTRQRTQRGATFKRRKLYGRYSMLISDGRNSSGVSSSANKGMNGATIASCVTIHGGSDDAEIVASFTGWHASQDLTYPILPKAIKAYGSLKIRIGGSLEDQIYYKVGKFVNGCPDLRLSSKGFLFGFSHGCLDMARWDQAYNLLNRSKIFFRQAWDNRHGSNSGPDNCSRRRLNG